MSPPIYQIWWPLWWSQLLRQWELAFNCNVIPKETEIVTWLYQWKCLKLSHQPARSGRDLTYLICHATSQDHLIKELSNFMGGGILLYVNTLSSLVVICIAVVKIHFQIDNQDAIGHVILCVEDPYVGHQPAKVGGHWHCGSGHMFLVCHTILKNVLIKGSWEFKGGIPLRYFTSLSVLVDIGIVVEDI